MLFLNHIRLCLEIVRDKMVRITWARLGRLFSCCKCEFFLICILVIWQVIAANSVDVMCNCHGSHVLRSLLCLCKGVPLDKSRFYLSKSTTVLAERLNSKEFPSKKDDAANFQSGFPNLLNLLVSEMLKHARKCIKALQVDTFSSLVFQACFPDNFCEFMYAYIHTIRLVMALFAIRLGGRLLVFF